MVEVFDCTMPFPNVIPVPQPYAVWLEGDDSCAPVDAPSNPSPADGATDVPLNATLTCELHEAEYFSACVPLGYEWAAVDFGTTPDPPPAGVLPYAPRGLVPGTTYHWRVNHKYFAAAVVSSPVWSFTTTTTPNPTEASTWGRIKAFYRR